MSQPTDRITNNAVAAYLQFLRKGRGLSQQAIAERIGVPTYEIEYFERAQGEISEQTLWKLVSGLGAADEHVRYLLAATAETRDERAQLIRKGIDLARAWLRGEDLLKKRG